jgi:hypothetical protein
MRNFLFNGTLLLFLTLSACVGNYSVDLKVHNNTSKKITITYVQKDNNKVFVKTLNPGQTFAISKYDRPGNEPEWKIVWKFNIKSVTSENGIESWKDYNVEGAWDHENLTNKTKSVLVIAPEDFVK